MPAQSLSKCICVSDVLTGERSTDCVRLDKCVFGRYGLLQTSLVCLRRWKEHVLFGTNIPCSWNCWLPSHPQPCQSLLQIILKRLPFFLAPQGTTPSTGVYGHAKEKMKTQSEKSEHLQGMAVVYINKQERNVLDSYLASACGIGQFSSMAIQTEHSQQPFFEQKDCPFTSYSAFSEDIWM